MGRCGHAALIGTGGALIWLVAPVGIFIGSIDTVSVIKAVYVEKHDLKCVCVDGGSNVPLGAISLSENLILADMSIWILSIWFAST